MKNKLLAEYRRNPMFTENVVLALSIITTIPAIGVLLFAIVTGVAQ